MVIDSLGAIGKAAAPALGNHLWQSTLCLLVATLLAFIFRNNHARVRYGLWQAASLKFLVPFSLFVAIGMHVGGPLICRSPASADSRLYFAMVKVSQPFGSRATPPSVAPSSSTPNPITGLRRQVPFSLPLAVAAIWLCGFLGVLAVWCARWRHLAAELRRAAPLSEGREVEALRRVATAAKIRTPIGIRLSQKSTEPGIFGILRPVLVWPTGISELLDEAHLEAILAHELSHVRRRDNLAAALHMLVEAVFWFHPLVWWLGARLVEERERACDEEVLRSGNAPRVYAESILKACEFCVELPLACVSGVTGADLKQRIVRIMTQHWTTELNFGRKLLLGGVAAAALAGPVVFGLLHAPQVRAQSTAPPAPSFEVASIKLNKPDVPDRIMFAIRFAPGRFTATGVSAKQLIALAYDVRDTQISGGPSWFDSERYDIDAKETDADAATIDKLPPEQRRLQHELLLQSLLADRFKLKIRRESKESSVYALVVAKNGPKLHEAKPGDTYPNGLKGLDGKAGGGQMMRIQPGEVVGQGLTIEALARMLSQQMGRQIEDRTGLTGKYDFTLKWTPDPATEGPMMGPPGGAPPAVGAPPPDSSGPSIFTALQEQLGLKLESAKGPVDLIVIDQIEKPSAD